jgi:hypothetical protein
MALSSVEQKSGIIGLRFYCLVVIKKSIIVIFHSLMALPHTIENLIVINRAGFTKFVFLKCFSNLGYVSSQTIN